MSEQEQDRHQTEEESVDKPDVEGHAHDVFMRDDAVMRDDVFDSEERHRLDEAL